VTELLLPRRSPPFLARLAIAILPLMAAACGPQTRREPFRALEGCRSPDSTQFHGVRWLMTHAYGPDLTRDWINGCAIISFELDASGRIVDPRVVMEAPAGSGVGAFAIRTLEPDLFAAASERYRETRAPVGPHARYATTVGLAMINGQPRVTHREVTSYY
jgi:hypothetical protein